MKHSPRPTMSYRLPSPSGDHRFPERSSSAADCTALAASTTIRARVTCRRLARRSSHSTWSARSKRPVPMRSALLRVAMVSVPPRAAVRSRVSATSALAPTGQAYSLQGPQCTQAGRPRYGTELISSGVGNGRRPSAVPASARTAPWALNGWGGIRGGAAGGSSGSAPSARAMPNRPSISS
ncbi:hypothetical protein LUX33_23735 [Actinomadura madurae]|nr:hypothetical protein [Actinomadura madurae]MCP9951129.1 hypothetical protein [Actinomadura madurae]